MVCLYWTAYFCNRLVLCLYGYKTINGCVGMSVATQVNYHCPFYGRKCYQCGYWNNRGNECEIITHQDRKI